MLHKYRPTWTNEVHNASGYRVRTDAGHATPLAGPTYRAQTRYRLVGPHPAGEKLLAGTWDRPAVPALESSPFTAGRVVFR